MDVIVSYAKASKADKLSKSVQEQLNQAVADGDQLAETQQARVDANGNPHDTLKTRIDSEVQGLRSSVSNVNTQVNSLAQDVTQQATQIQGVEQQVQAVEGDMQGVSQQVQSVEDDLAVTNVTVLGISQELNKTVRSVNGMSPDASGNVVIRESGGGSGVLVFDTQQDFESEHPNGLPFPVWIVTEEKWVYRNEGGTIPDPDPDPEDTTPPIITASPNGGTFTAAQTVTLTANEPATIYYTLDGSTPTKSSIVYSKPFTVSETKTLKYFGVDTAGNESAVQMAVFTISVSEPDPEDIKVTGVTLNRVATTLEEGDSIQLIATVEPSNATNQDITWSSNNESVATVDSNGLVSAGDAGSATITVTTVDESFTATCNINVIAAVVGFDYNNLMGTVGDDTVTFDQIIVEGKEDWVHPSVLYFEEGWNGHKYWMGINAYPGTTTSEENPYLFYSDDGDSWHTPSGLTQPIYGIAPGTRYNSDAHIFMDYDGVTMHYLNRAYIDSDTKRSLIEIFSTTDGVDFTPRTTIVHTDTHGVDVLSPSICRVDGKYYMFGVDNHNQDFDHLVVLEADEPYGTWTVINNINTGNLGEVWHPEVQYVNQEFIVISSTGFASGGNLVLGKFYDVMDDYIEARNSVLFVPPKTQVHNQAIYKSSFVVKSQGEIDLFLGVKGGTLDSNTPWKVTRVHLTRIPITLDLSEYKEVMSFPTNDQNIMDVGYLKHAIDFTITDLEGQFRFFSDVTNHNAQLMLDSNKQLHARLWRLTDDDEELYSKTTFIPYGISVGDRITAILDDSDLQLYINGRLIYEEQNIVHHFPKQAMSFGGGDVVGKMSDIKIYQLDHHIFSETKAFATKADLLTEFATDPTPFVLVDEFERADGDVGISDNGVEYNIVGNPTISNNRYRPNTRDNGIFIDVEPGKDYTVLFGLSSSTAPDSRPYLYTSYTDSDNWERIYFPINSHQVYLETNDAGTTSSLQFNEYQRSGRRNYKIDLVGDEMIIYADGVLVAELEKPEITKFGLSASYANNYYDYWIVKEL